MLPPVALGPVIVIGPAAVPEPPPTTVLECTRPGDVRARDQVHVRAIRAIIGENSVVAVGLDISAGCNGEVLADVDISADDYVAISVVVSRVALQT